MTEKILSRLASVLIFLVILVQLFSYPGVEILLALFFISAILLCLYYIKESGASIYTLVMILYTIGFMGYLVNFYTELDIPGIINLSLVAHVIFALLLFWTSRLLHKKIGGDSFYVSITAVVLLLHVLIILFANDKWQALGSNLYYVLLGLIATVKIKTEIDKALIPAEQKILNLILLVIAYPISNLVVSTIQNL